MREHKSACAVMMDLPVENQLRKQLELQKGRIEQMVDAQLGSHQSWRFTSKGHLETYCKTRYLKTRKHSCPIACRHCSKDNKSVHCMV